MSNFTISSSIDSFPRWDELLTVAFFTFILLLSGNSF